MSLLDYDVGLNSYLQPVSQLWEQPHFAREEALDSPSPTSNPPKRYQHTQLRLPFPAHFVVPRLSAQFNASSVLIRPLMTSLHRIYLLIRLVDSPRNVSLFSHYVDFNIIFLFSFFFLFSVMHQQNNMQLRWKAQCVVVVRCRARTGVRVLQCKTYNPSADPHSGLLQTSCHACY